MAHPAYRQNRKPLLPCEMDPDRWFGDPKQDRVLVESAIAACRVCPWLAQCLTYAEKVPNKYGVWAGRHYDGGMVSWRG